MAGRPSKPVGTGSGAMSKAEKKRRAENEDAIKGGSTEVKRPTMDLSKDQKKLRKKLLKELEKVLTNVDCYILDLCVISLDRLQKIEKSINENPEKMYDKSVISAKKQYWTEFARCCSELSMSPQSRSKIANSISQNQNKNPLRDLFNDDE